MKKNIQIVMLGDSLTARGDWKNLLAKEDCIVNLGINGDTTKGILNRIDRVINLEEKILFLMIGVNDLCCSIPLIEVFQNYIQILEKLEKTNIKLIIQAILLTQMKAVNKKILEFNLMLEEYCKNKQLIFFDMNPYLCEDNLLKEIYTTDGLHLNLKAYEVWARKIKENLLLNLEKF
jgi:lysophospholipase L1-like esterase